LGSDTLLSKLLKITLIIAVTAACAESILYLSYEAMAQGIPDLSRLDDETRQSILLTCIVEKGRGPARYAECLRSHLASMGIAPSEKPREPVVPRPGPQPRLRPPLIPKEIVTPKGSPMIPTQPPGSGELPPIPIAIETGRLSASEVFKRVGPTIYVVIAGRNLNEIQSGQAASQGSAVAISSSLLLTNCHVVATKLVIYVLQGEDVHEVTIRYSDTKSDRCILKTQTASLNPVAGVRLYRSLEIGEQVFSVGSPKGLERTLGQGLISGLRSERRLRLIQTSAPISGGSSGGGLFDDRGNLIGITTFLMRESQNLNFAIAAEDYWVW